MTTDPNQTAAPTDPGAEDFAPEDKALWAEFDQIENEKPAEDADDDAPPAAAAPAAAAPADDDTGNATAWGDKDGTGEGDEAATAAPAAPADPAPAKPAAAKTAPAPAAPTPDPYESWAKLSPEEKAATAERLGKTPQAIDVEINSNRGRIRSMQQRINELERKVGTTATGAAKPAAPVADPASVLDTAFQSEKWKKFAEEYGEVAAPLADTLRDIFGPVIADQANMKSVTSTIETERQAADQRARDAAVLAAHPDFENIVKAKDFGDWAITQPDSIKAVLRKNANGIADPEEAVRVLTTYKLDRGIPTIATPAPTPAPATPPAKAGTSQSSAGNLSARRQAQLASATSPSSRSPGVAQGGEPQSEEEAWDYWDKREKKEEARRHA